MAKDSRLHKEAYFLHRQGNNLVDIVSQLGESSPAAIHRWSTSDTSCSCPWHNWQQLKSIYDTDDNHGKAMTLAAAGHPDERIAAALSISKEIVEAWSQKDYPCHCGCHGWSGVQTSSKQLEVTKPDIIFSPALLPTDVGDAHDVAIHVTLDALAKSIRAGDVAPRSWRDVLDTLKLVNELRTQRRQSPFPSDTPSVEVTETRKVKVTGGESTESKQQGLENDILASCGLPPGFQLDLNKSEKKE